MASCSIFLFSSAKKSVVFIGAIKIYSLSLTEMPNPTLQKLNIENFSVFQAEQLKMIQSKPCFAEFVWLWKQRPFQMDKHL
jgi:hypothetical protein